MVQSKFNLPDETVEFLRSGLQLDYDPDDCECGEVLLKQLHELTLDEVWIGTDSPADPMFGEKGFYRIPAVSLSGQCKAYAPEFILLWLPNERRFGTWDCDHWKLEVFKNAVWADIVTDPAQYLGASWVPDADVSSQLNHWEDYAFEPGMPF